MVCSAGARARDRGRDREALPRHEGRDFEVEWPKRSFAANLAAFYGWKSWHIWRNKARKCGTGPFRVIVVEDPSPVWRRDMDTYGHELVVDANVYDLKKSFRSLTGRSNVVHSSVTADETAHQLAALSSPSNDPIPFRAMRYPDDERIRLVRRRVWLGIAGDVLVPLAASIAAVVAVWGDVLVNGPACTEYGLVEWSGLVLSAVSGALMTLCAIRAKSGRGAHALAAAFFFDMSIREIDFMLDRAFGACIWPWALTAVTLTFTAVTVRYAKTVYPGLRDMRRSRRFPLFACGAALEFARNRGRSGDQPFHRGERGALRLRSHVRLGRTPRAARLPRPQTRRGTKWPNSVFRGCSPLKGGCRSCDSCLIMEA